MEEKRRRLYKRWSNHRIIFALKVAGIKPPKAVMDAMDVMKLGAGICAGVLVKDYAVSKKWINE